MSSLGISGAALNRLAPIAARLARLFLEHDMTLAESNPLGELHDGDFVALDAHMDMDNEARRLSSPASGSMPRTTGGWRATSPSLTATSAWSSAPAAGRSPCLTPRAHGGNPANYCEIGGNPSVAKWCGLAKLVLQKPGGGQDRGDDVDRLKHARGHRRPRRHQGLSGARAHPAEKIAIFRIPGAWEDEGVKILERYGIPYADRSVSLHEAARRAVERIAEAVSA